MAHAERSAHRRGKADAHLPESGRLPVRSAASMDLLGLVEAHRIVMNPGAKSGS